MHRRLLAALALATAAPLFATPPEPPPASPIPDLADGTAAALQHMKSFRVPAGLTVELFAAEPKLASPVAISVDEKGRVFVAEEYRLGKGAAENRGNPKDNFSFWLDDELQLQKLDDRLSMYRRWEKKFPGGMEWFTKWSDQVRLVEDTNGDGKADKASVFAGGFNGPLDGLAAGVLAKDGDVYLTNIPSLWKMKDGGKGVAATKEALLSGFGVNCAFYGHDLHGLIFGPDGKLYFSVGDRGFHVTSKEGKQFSGLRTGAVFRCDPDGTNFEVVMRGLRNPQELAFDQYGNLFADDNNCDKGDHARLVYVCEDGDSGWHMEYQTINPPYMGGPWFAERLWHLPHAGQPAYLVPPVGKIGTGPSGFLFTSGTTLPDRYKNAFIMCNYAGSRGLEAFKVTPKGAGFEIADYHDFLTPIMATDVDQGPDGKLYVSDFVNLDWGGKSLGGRIYTVFDKQKVNTPEALETKKLFAEGFGKQSDGQLAKLLAHPEQPVRLRAQWELARRGGKVIPVLADVLATSQDQLARIHALWGLGQLARKQPEAGQLIAGRLSGPDGEVMAQAAKLCGDIGHAPAAEQLVRILVDPLTRGGDQRGKFFAAQSLGKLKHRPAVEPLFRVLAENKDADPWLRHACVAALARIGDADAVAAKATDPNASVRLGVVLVQRKLGDKRVAKLLTDADPLVRTEAARAVHDLPIESEFAALAAVLPNLTAATDDESIARRAISANYRLGGAEHATRVLAAAASPSLSPAVRQEAVLALRDWSNPPPRDRVTGFWNPLPKRDAAVVRGVVGPRFEKLLGSASGPLLTDVVGLIGPLGLEVSESTLTGWVAEAGKGVPVRVAALRVLADRRAKALPESVAVALKDSAPLLRAEARDVLAATDPTKGVQSLMAVLTEAKAATAEKQRALATLTKVKAPAAGAALDQWAEKLTAKAVPAELQLDVIEALKAAPSPARDKARTGFEGALPGGPAYSKFAVSLVGGDATRGREVFVGHAAAQCLRCHVVGGSGGNAGPDLSKVAGQPGKDRAYLMESLLNPSAKIAPGFGAVTMTLLDGRSVSGVLAEENAKAVVLVHPDGRRETIATEDIERRTQPTSAMPAVDRALTPREVRDLVEYLSTLK
ncbi:PVC-type heme-binding CxxCH protein [Urbifossiella limnaea]|uniref:Cytochrome c n=1 Tax=Urbifossiella limnaea TaxID=2528023 RepID=A0A517XR20_9BACT|nr:PVC-type heme-binding CxxCH protein [Urbifossiella limnaea]QDU19951.1 Cytochrome c [Urbifossiella limnaea]